MSKRKAPTKRSPSSEEDHENAVVKVIAGDALVKLAELSDEFFQCCITSPPYWGLRNYGIEGQIGAEEDVELYVDRIVEVFRQVKRTLKKDGTLWLVIGDSYTSGGRSSRNVDKKNAVRSMDYRFPTPAGLKPKDLIGVPWKVAFALQKDGWYLRTEIIWQKPNCQPESVKDRPTRSHEYLFLFSKSQDYLYHHERIKEPTADGEGTRNRRSVWSIPTEPSKSRGHIAAFPAELVRLCLLAGSDAGSWVLDPFIGSGTVAEVCHENYRNCVGIELHPEYVLMVDKRVAKNDLMIYSGQKF